jgi:outer membrane cobalamin receptor
MEYHGTVFGDRNSTFFTSNDTLAGIVEDYLYETSKIGLHNLFHLDLYYTRLTCGFDFRYDTLNASEYSLFSDTIWEASVWNAGAWAALTAYITDELALSPSVRIDRNQTFGFFLSPHLGIIQRYGDMFIVKASVGKAFRAPTLNDLYYPLSGNEQLKPEHGWSYELRFEGMPAHYMFAAFSFYFREVFDRITWLPIDEAIWRPHNMNSLTMKGFDLETMVTISNRINISLQGTALEARQRNNEIVYDYYDYGGDSSVTIIHEIERKAVFIPDFSIVLMMTFSLPYGLNCGIEGRYVSEQCNYYPDYSEYPVITMDTKTLASFNVYDLYIQKRLHRLTSLSNGIKNVLNSEYATQFGYSIHDRDFPMPGRTFYAEVSVHY